jgi:dolichyl-phosphate-mannose--protein O-mannosyl transferase
MKKRPFSSLDERNKLLAYKIVAVMYFLTIIAIQGIVIYRQFVLGQEIRDFEDIAIIMTVNSIFLVTALLYFGIIPFQQVRIKTILMVYLTIVVLGSLFTYAKYNLFRSPGLSMKELFDKLIIVFAVTGLIVMFFVIFSILGKRRMDRELKE